MTKYLIVAGIAFAPAIAAADHHHPRCELVGGELVEDPGGAANCPADHPGCFVGHIHGHHLHATTQFFAEGAVASPPQSPGWFNYSGVTTYTMDDGDGSIITRETGLATNFNIPESDPDGRASLSMEVITGGTGDLAGATGYLFVTGFNDPSNHVVSLVQGKICRP